MQRLHSFESWRTNRGKLPADYLLSEKVFFPKASVARNWEIRKIQRIQFAMQEEQLYAADAGQDKSISVYQSHQTYFVFRPLFSKPILTRQIILSMKNSQEFLASQDSVLRRNKATNSSTSNRPFFSCTARKPLYLVIYSSFLDLTSHSHGKFAAWR